MSDEAIGLIILYTIGCIVSFITLIINESMFIKYINKEYPTEKRDGIKSKEIFLFFRISLLSWCVFFPAILLLDWKR